MIKGILWDNDGVLIDTEGLFFQATRNALRSAGVELSRERYVEWSLRQGRSSFDLLQERGCTPAQIEELRFQRDQAYSRMLANGPGMIDGILEVLTLLRPKFRMAIVTTSRREHFELMHQRSNLSQFFEFALTREDYGRSKPHPEPYLTALERLQLSAKECIAIEDSGARLALLPGRQRTPPDHALYCDSEWHDYGERLWRRRDGYLLCRSAAGRSFSFCKNSRFLRTPTRLPLR